MTPPPAEHLAARVFLGPALRAQPDRRLVDLVRNGYDAAFEEIVRRYRRPLDRFAAAIVGGHSEDVTQDAFSKALLALRGSEAEIELRPWLYRIVRNTALNDLRDRPAATEELAETLPGGLSAAAEAEAREELRELTSRLRALPEPQRAALVMRELEGLSHEEIAAALGVSGGAARQAIFRARAALRDGLGLLLPMPLLRALAEHGDDAARAGGAIAAGAGASTAGGAAIGGGALKVGLATVLVAGAVGGGVAIDRHHGDRAGPEAAAAAPLARSGNETASASRASANGEDSPNRSHGSGSDAERGNDRNRGAGGDDDGSSPETSDLSGSGGSGSHHSGERSGHSGEDRSGHGGPGPSSASGSDSSGSGSGSSHGEDGGGGDHSGSGSGSDDGTDDRSGSGSGSGSGSDGGSLESGDDGGGSGSGSGEALQEPAPEPEIADGGSSGSGSSSSGSGSGNDDFSGSETSGLDGSP